MRHRGGRSNLADPLGRAAIVNDVAEGEGRFSRPDKSRFYTTAIGSATESTAMLDVCLRRQLVSSEDHERGNNYWHVSSPCS
ncbi:MAG: four helix bundle protein [Deltaproteobacteria bacterium]